MHPMPQVGELVVLLDQTPELTRLEIRSRAGWPGRIAFGLLTVIVMIPTAAGIASQHVGFSLAAALVGSLLLAAVYFASRWSHRQGIQIDITRDFVRVKKHWSDGGEFVEFPTDEAGFMETKRAISVRRELKIPSFGQSLSSEERHALCEFLNGRIQEMLNPPVSARNFPFKPHIFEVSMQPNDPGLAALALCQSLRRCGSDSIQVAPRIPRGVLAAALQQCLVLQDDEVLLSVLGWDENAQGTGGCALTTRRIYWRATEAVAHGGQPNRCEWLDYSDVPDTIGRVGASKAILDLGGGRTISLNGDKALANALPQYLGRVKAPALDAPIPEADWARAREDWPKVVLAGSEAMALQNDLRSFHRRAILVARPIVTPVICVACFVLYAVMVAQGVSPFSPTPKDAYDWGATFGPSVVFDHQYWRLLSAMFLHFGVIHLGFNMYCLAQSGAMVERFFGHFRFAVLYLFSGIGGGIASLWYHPVVIGAGASGAIFGVIGGLIGYLAVRRHEVPPAILKPMWSGAMAFVGYNTIFSLSVPGIDTSAHLGGLATGIACGFLMTLARPRNEISQLGALARQGVVLAILTAALGVIGWAGLDASRTKMLADPGVGNRIRFQLNAAPAFNDFSKPADKVLQELSRMANAVDGLLGEMPKETFDAKAQKLSAECQGLKESIDKLPAANPEIEEMRSCIAAAQRLLLTAIETLERFQNANPEDRQASLEGFQKSGEAFGKELEKIAPLRDAYVRKYELEVQTPGK